jgi:molybdopterin converting factor small subunit
MGNAIRVRVKIFGAPSLALECKELTFELNEQATIGDLLKHLPIEDRDYVYVVRAGIRLKSSTKLEDDDEIMVVPSIAGG